MICPRLLTLAPAAVALVAAASPAPSAAPSPGPPAVVRASASPQVRRAIAMCGVTRFYNWPARDTAPYPASYPPARVGDAFHVVGDPQLALTGQNLYETTIDVVHPFGNGVHYYVEQACVNVG